jgi:hypothetical protein
MLVAAYLPPNDGKHYITVHIDYETAQEIAQFKDCYAPLLRHVAELCAVELDD